MSAGLVALKSKDGSVRCSFVRGDFEDGMGLLYRYYLNADRVNALLDFGTIDAVKPQLSPVLDNHVSTYVYRNDQGDWVKDRKNTEYSTFKEFMSGAYTDFYIWNDFMEIMLFDEETNEWYVVNRSSRKLTPFQDAYFKHYNDTLESVEEYHAFIKSLIPQEALDELEKNNGVPGRYLIDKFGKKVYNLSYEFASSAKTIQAAKNNGNKLPEPEIVWFISEEEKQQRYEEIINGRSRKPEIMDFVVEQMRGMSFEEIEEKIVRNGLGAPEKEEPTQVSSNSLENAKIYLKVVEMIGNENRERKIRFLPITEELENMTISEIPALLGIENATVEIYHDQKDKNASYAILSTRLPFAEEVTVKKYAIFSLMESIENHASMIRTMKTAGHLFDDRRRKEVLTELAEKENLALNALRTVMDEATLKVAVERIREIRNLVEVYELIDELGILETEPNKGPKK